MKAMVMHVYMYIWDSLGDNEFNGRITLVLNKEKYNVTLFLILMQGKIVFQHVYEAIYIYRGKYI